MNTSLPELLETDAKHEAALKKLAAAESNLEHVRGAAQEAARRVDLARQRLQSNRDALTEAQRRLTEALGSNMPTEKFQQAVAGCRANVDSLEALLTEATQAAAAADRAVGQAGKPIGDAQLEVVDTRYYQLVVKLAKALPDVIKITRELVTISQHHKIQRSLEGSGYVLDLSRPNIGHYTVADNGDLSFLLR
jgi:chromosome segregation ATPase